MKHEKLERYSFKCGIHTLEIESESYSRPTKIEVRSSINKVTLNSKTERYEIIINPNKLHGDIFSFRDFIVCMKEILSDMQIDRFRLKRVDLKFDNYIDSYYKDFLKLNRYLIACISIMFSMKNTYETHKLFNKRPLSIAVKCPKFQVEFYNRAEKNSVVGDQTEPTKARFEIRSNVYQFRTYGIEYVNLEQNMEILKKEMYYEWLSRFKKIPECLHTTQEICNQYFVENYGENIYRNITDFLRESEYMIFCNRQMVDLLKQMGVQNPEAKAKYHKKHYHTEYFSKNNVKTAISEIEKAMEEFFLS